MSLNPDYDSNPYNPTFGTPPAAYIHRYSEETQLLNEFCAEKSQPLAYMIIGARGMGKTVLMHEMANRFESFPEWVVVRMNPNADMLESLMKKLSGHKKVAPIIKSAKINLSFFSLSVQTSGQQLNDPEDAISEIVKSLQKKGKKLLIIVDEATNTEYMRVFASTYQNLIGQKLPVYLLMTGLYENISSVRNEKNLTFLYRMPRIQLSSLDLGEIAENYRDVFELDYSEAIKMANYTKGYSYAFQLLGKLAWDAGGEYLKVQDVYRSDLRDMVYEKIWDEMSDKDKTLAYGIAKSEAGKIKEIREILHWEPNEVSPYKERLTRKGIIYNPEHGQVELALPYFKGYVLENYKYGFEVRELPPDL